MSVDLKCLRNNTICFFGQQRIQYGRDDARDKSVKSVKNLEVCLEKKKVKKTRDLERLSRGDLTMRKGEVGIFDNSNSKR